jgi:signal transduction histidine kinase/ActR/RegA family two-component response regulator
VPIFRNGKIEDVYWTYTYSPVFAEDGAVGGTLVICTETTSRVLAERRSDLLHALVGETSVAGDRESLATRAFDVIGRAGADIPFAALYDRDPETGALAPEAQAGLDAETAVAVGRRAATELARRANAEAFLTLAREPGEAATGGPLVNLTLEIYVAPLAPLSDDRPSFLVFGISPRLSFDDAYRRFLEQVTGHLQVARIRVAEAAHRATIELERRNLLEQAPVATAVLVGPRHVIELANPLYRQMVGRPDIVGKAYIEAFPELAETPLPGILDRVYRTGEAHATGEFLVPIERTTGTIDETFFKFNFEPIRDAHRAVYAIVAVAVDITEQVAARRVLERSQAEREGLLRELQTANRTKDEFLAMLGHELRNPLSPIITAIHLMRHKTAGPLTREQQVIERQVNHLIRLVDDLLDVAKIARGKVELRREIVDLADVIPRAAEMASDLLEERHHRLTISCERGRFLCDVDPTRLSQVLANLLTNAARYTDPGGEISVDVRASNGDVIVTVRDNGIGISAEMLPRIFNLFEQAARSADRAQGGLGIGLALVKNLVTLHGGTVSAHSDGPGRGSTFTVCLTAVDRGQPSDRAPVQQRVAPSISRSTRVLVVDDNFDAAEMLKHSLEAAGHEVEMATEPIGALEIAARFNPQVAILDIGLPVIDGYELATRLRALPGAADCRLIALTGYGQEHDRRRSVEVGFHAHLVKPVDIDYLVHLVDVVRAAPPTTPELATAHAPFPATPSDG